MNKFWTNFFYDNDNNTIKILRKQRNNNDLDFKLQHTAHTHTAQKMTQNYIFISISRIIASYT